MGGAHNIARLPIGLVVVVGFWGVADLQAGAADEWRSRVSTQLLSIYDAPSAPRPATVDRYESERAANARPLEPRFNEQGWVQADVHYDCSQNAPVKALASAGLAVSSSARLATLCVVEGWIAPQSLPAIAASAGVTRVTVPAYALHPRRVVPEVRSSSMAAVPESSGQSERPAAASVAGIDQNGVTIMHADQFVAQTGADGGGAKVGVQSAGISSLQTIQSRGELPGVQVVKPSDGASSPAGDEGTALLEEVHAVAPGAGLAYCGPGTFIEYTSCLNQLIAAGATILVDDLIFPQQDLLSSDSSAAQAVGQLLAQNPSVTLFTAQGNYNGSYWEGNYSPVALSSVGLPPLTCPSGGITQTDYYAAQFDGAPSQLLTVTQSSRIPVAFAWADPPDHNASKFDVYWVDSTDNTKSGCLSTASATDTQVAVGTAFSAGSYTLYIATPDAAASGKFLKLWVGGDGLTSLSKPTTGSIVTAQAFASGAVTVGAVNGSDGVGNKIERFSSLGPIAIAFPDVTRIQAPVLVAPDGINVDAAGTYFAGSLFPDGNFYGTSASAPNAAGVAALIRGAFPNLTALQLVAALKAGAVQLGSAPPDGTYGYGRIDATGALGTFPVPTITPLPDSALTAGSSSASYPFTVSGTGALHFAVTSSNTTSIPASVVAAGSPGVTIAPADCGIGTLSCTLSVMPANGPGGTVTVTVAALDGASRSASATMTVTVTGSATPPPPPATPEPTPSSGGGGGGGLDWWVIASLLLIAGRSVRRRCSPSGGRMKRCFPGLFILASALFTCSQTCSAETPMVPWLTRSADNSRSGWNPNEKLLSQASVESKGIVRTTIIPVFGDARGIEGQPLILPDVKLKDGSTHDVMVLPSMANVVRGVDAHSGAELWTITLGRPIDGRTPIGPRKAGPDGCVGDFPTIDCHAINDKWGVLSTGVIDPQTQRLYLVAWISPDGTPQNARHHVFVLNVADGGRVVPPVPVEATSGGQSYASSMRKQRSALVLTRIKNRKTIFWASGTVQETGNAAAGWIFAFDCAKNKITAALAMSAGEGAGIWMAGQGLAADAQGFLYAITGNGDFDGRTQWGESFLKVQYTPASGLTKAKLKVVDHWTPWTDLVRTGQQRMASLKLAGVSAPTEAVKPVGSGMNMPLNDATFVTNINERGAPVLLVFPQMAGGAWSDEDWGSAGPACIFAIGVCVATGKDGIAYPIRTANLGATTAADLGDPKANCNKLAAPPVWLTMSPGPVDPCPNDPRTLNFFPWGNSAHLHMTPVQFFDPVLRSWTLFAWGENAQLHKWRVSDVGALTYVAQSHEYASADVRGNPPGGMPGGFCSGSSNGADPDSAILVCTIPYGDANAQVVNGRLLVYDPVHLAPDKSLKVLWDSQRWGIPFLFNKFNPPVIDGGQIYVPNYNGGVDVYKLTP